MSFLLSKIQHPSDRFSADHGFENLSKEVNKQNNRLLKVITAVAVFILIATIITVASIGFTASVISGGALVFLAISFALTIVYYQIKKSEPIPTFSTGSESPQSTIKKLPLPEYHDPNGNGSDTDTDSDSESTTKSSQESREEVKASQKVIRTKSESELLQKSAKVIPFSELVIDADQPHPPNTIVKIHKLTTSIVQHLKKDEFAQKTSRQVFVNRMISVHVEIRQRTRIKLPSTDKKLPIKEKSPKSNDPNPKPVTPKDPNSEFLKNIKKNQAPAAPGLNNIYTVACRYTCFNRYHIICNFLYRLI